MPYLPHLLRAVDYGQAKIAQQFHEDFRTPPVYYFQLLAFAQGVPYDRLNFDRHRFKPECLRRYEGSAEAGQE